MVKNISNNDSQNAEIQYGTLKKNKTLLEKLEKRPHAIY